MADITNDFYNFSGRDYLEEPPEVFATITVDKKIIVCILFITSIAVNTFLLIQQLYSYRQQSPYNNKFSLVLVHLAISNILVACFCMLKSFIWMMTLYWQAGNGLCKFLTYVRMFTLYLNSCSILAVLTASVVAKLIRKINHWVMVFVLLAPCWVFSALFSIPEAVMYGSYKVSENSDLEQCYIRNTHRTVAYFYHEIIIVPLAFLFPFIFACMLTFVLYCHKGKNKASNISTTATSSPTTTTSSSITTNTYELTEAETDLSGDQVVLHLPGHRREKMDRMPVVVAAIYFSCWIPFAFLSIFNMFVDSNKELLYFWSYYIGVSNVIFTGIAVLVDSFVGLC